MTPRPRYIVEAEAIEARRRKAFLRYAGAILAVFLLVPLLLIALRAWVAPDFIPEPPPVAWRIAVGVVFALAALSVSAPALVALMPRERLDGFSFELFSVLWILILPMVLLVAAGLGLMTLQGPGAWLMHLGSDAEPVVRVEAVGRKPRPAPVIQWRCPNRIELARQGFFVNRIVCDVPADIYAAASKDDVLELHGRANRFGLQVSEIRGRAR